MLALMDGSHGPTDQYGTHFLQLVVFDTSTGEQLYRTPDGDPDPDEDVTDLYEESMPIWEWVTDEQIAIEGVTVDITTGDVTVQDPERVGAYLFADR